MSEGNVEVVRKAIEALNRRDVPAARALWGSGAEIDWSRSKGPLKGVYRGRGEIGNFQNEFWSTFEKVELEAQRTGRSRAFACSKSGPKPSKQSGCGSRRCRRRTSSWYGKSVIP